MELTQEHIDKINQYLAKSKKVNMGEDIATRVIGYTQEEIEHLEEIRQVIFLSKELDIKHSMILKKYLREKFDNLLGYNKEIKLHASENEDATEMVKRYLNMSDIDLLKSVILSEDNKMEAGDIYSL